MEATGGILATSHGAPPAGADASSEVGGGPTQPQRTTSVEFKLAAVAEGCEEEGERRGAGPSRTPAEADRALGTPGELQERMAALVLTPSPGYTQGRGSQAEELGKKPMAALGDQRQTETVAEAWAGAGAGTVAQGAAGEGSTVDEPGVRPGRPPGPGWMGQRAENRGREKGEGWVGCGHGGEWEWC